MFVFAAQSILLFLGPKVSRTKNEYLGIDQLFVGMFCLMLFVVFLLIVQYVS